jgi:hypothetical protein
VGSFDAGESLKETIGIPAGTLCAVGDRFNHSQIGRVELCRGFEVDRLLKIVRRRVISLLSPALDDLVFGRVLDKPTLERVPECPF